MAGFAPDPGFFPSAPNALEAVLIVAQVTVGFGVVIGDPAGGMTGAAGVRLLLVGVVGPAAHW